MHLPEGLKEPVLTLTKRVVTACEQGQRIIDELDELVETGFGDSEVGRVEEMMSELGRLESETDADFDRAARALFAMEEDLGVATFFWYQIILWISNLADISERVGNRLRLLMAT